MTYSTGNFTKGTTYLFRIVAFNANGPLNPLDKLTVSSNTVSVKI